MASKELERYYYGLQKKINSDKRFTIERMETLYELAYASYITDGDKDFAFIICKYTKNLIAQEIYKATRMSVFAFSDYCIKNGIVNKELNVFWDLIKLEAPDIFDSYLLYLEKNRLAKDRFYLPKRKQFTNLNIVPSLQDLEDDKLDILSISLPPGTGKTTIEKFFCSWIIGRHPDDYSLFFSHSADITRMFYDGVLDICTSDEYTWSEIFPNVKLESTNAKAETLNFNNYKPFPNLQCTSVGSKNAGKVRTNRYLYCDDLIGGIEEALNKNILDKLWRIYNTDALQRKYNDQVKEIHIATRWSVHDPIGRLQNIYEGNDRARFLSVPCYDPKTGKSNFDYDIGGMSTKFFKQQEAVMDEISFQCLYMNEPIEREGQLYHEDELRRYLSLPDREPDAILGVCDVKNRGTDYMFLPCLYQYDEDFYLVDCVCDDSSDYSVQYTKLTNLILSNNMQQVEFESNSGGDRVSFEVSERVAREGGRCSITNHPTETNKDTRIITNADWIKRNVIFRDKSLYKPREDYGVMMKWLFSYTQNGKNTHDDVPDGLANFCLFVTRKQKVSSVSAMHNPFRSNIMRGYPRYRGYVE